MIKNIFCFRDDSSQERVRENKIYLYQKAFTLAEVLIVLGIIGLVADMTIPTLIGQYQKKVLQVQFMKSYSELSQINEFYKMNEGSSITEFDLTSTPDETIKKFMSYVKGAEKLSNSSMLAIKNQLGFFPNNLNKTYGGQICDASGLWRDNTGRYYIMDDPPSGNQKAGPKICIDINGQKGPNLWGYDWFVFTFDIKGQTVPYKYKWSVNNSDELLNKPEDQCQYSSTVSSSMSCSVFALQNKHPTIDGKDYWNDFLK